MCQRESHLTTYEATIRAEAAEELQTLRTKLAAQKTETEAAKARLKIQRSKRQAAEAEVRRRKEYKSKYEYQRKAAKKLEGMQQNYKAEVAHSKSDYMQLYKHVTSGMNQKARKLFKEAVYGTSGGGVDLKHEDV